MATPPHTTDPADEAGGEVVYSSDGLAPAPLTKPPEVVVTRELVQGEDVLDSEATFSPQQAFEIFQGKVYTNTNRNGGGGGGGSYPVILGKETPVARLARLQQEIQEVEAQFSTTAAGSGQDFDQELVSLATTLKTQLTTLSSSNRIMEHDDLTRLIRQQLESLKTTTTAVGEPGATGSEGANATGSNTGIVYELYGNASNPTTTLEDRLVRLERTVGSANSNNKSLLQRLEEMERLVKTVDAATFDQTATKAKVLRADLEAASKARNKLTATYKKEDSKMIQQLHSQMVELEGLSDYLPALVERLQQLANLHVQAGTFSTRLEALETSANQLAHSVSQAEGTMEQLATNLTENLTTMEGNLKVLDERLEKL